MSDVVSIDEDAMRQLSARMDKVKQEALDFQGQLKDLNTTIGEIDGAVDVPEWGQYVRALQVVSQRMKDFETFFNAAADKVAKNSQSCVDHLKKQDDSEAQAYASRMTAFSDTDRSDLAKQTQSESKPDPASSDSGGEDTDSSNNDSGDGDQPS